MKLTREMCEKALVRFAKPYQAKIDVQNAYYDCNGKEQSINNDMYLLGKLINEHFDNTLDFKQFKLHSDSTLRSLKKDELIDYINMVYRNWESADWYLYISTLRNKELSEEIEELKSNPPLKFEELHKGMPIWDSIQDVWLYVVDVHKDFGNAFTYVWWFDKNDDYYTQRYVEFEPNRYYRKQVE